MGTGYYTRANPEQCWILRKGKGIKRVSASVRRWLHAPVGAHSAKPQEFYDRVVALFGDVPRLDVFARDTRPGWTCVGNEIDGLDIVEALNRLKEIEDV
jgi:N6-adenosine-specific RNA methylase IME4